MTNRDHLRHLLTNITSELAVLDKMANSIPAERDVKTFESLVFAAILELEEVDPDSLEESNQVKPLHDRIHAIVLQLRIQRNTLERLERSAEMALDDVRKLSQAVEEPYSDEDL